MYLDFFCSLTFFFRLLCDVVVNFQTNQEEVTLIVNPERASFKNYVDDEPGIENCVDFVTPLVHQYIVLCIHVQLSAL